MSAVIETFENQKKLFETAAVLARSGKLDDAITIYDYLLVQNPTLPQYWTAGGIAKMKQGYLDEAFAQFQVAEAADEDDPVPVMMRGVCLLRMGRKLEAMVALQRAKGMAAGRAGEAWIAESVGDFLDRWGEAVSND